MLTSALRNAVILSCVVSALLAAEELPVLRVINWSTYIDAEPGSDKPTIERSQTLRDFMAAHHCRIEYIELDTEEEINAYVAQHLEDVDIVIDATEYRSNQHDQDAWLSIGPEHVPELHDLRPVPKALLGDIAKTTRIPYLWVTSGILYRSDLSPVAPTSWNNLIACQKSSVIDSALSMFTIALKRRNIALAAPTPEQLREAARDLRDWMASGRVQLVTGDLDAIEASLVAGDTTMSLMWSGDALRMIAEHPDTALHYVVPQEGGELSLDSWLINPRSPRRDLAVAFARYLLNPVVQSRICSSTYYAVSTNAAFAQLTVDHPQLAVNPGIEPPTDILAHCEDPVRLNGSDCQELWNRICTAVAGKAP